MYKNEILCFPPNVNCFSTRNLYNKCKIITQTVKNKFIYILKVRPSNLTNAPQDVRCMNIYFLNQIKLKNYIILLENIYKDFTVFITYTHFRKTFSLEFELEAEFKKF